MVKNELTYDANKSAGARMRTTGSTAWVIATQQVLRDKGFDPGTTDGLMGPRTTAALTAYQESEQLPATGTMDADTAAKLGVKVSTQGR
jgi:localization factor PodJL